MEAVAAPGIVQGAVVVVQGAVAVVNDTEYHFTPRPPP